MKFPCDLLNPLEPIEEMHKTPLKVSDKTKHLQIRREFIAEKRTRTKTPSSKRDDAALGFCPFIPLSVSLAMQNSSFAISFPSCKAKELPLPKGFLFDRTAAVGSRACADPWEQALILSLRVSEYTVTCFTTLNHVCPRPWYTSSAD